NEGRHLHAGQESKTVNLIWIDMPYFIIQLTDKSQWEVYYGSIYKKTSFGLFKKRKSAFEVKTGYLVKLISGQAGPRNIMLYKSANGQWSNGPIPIRWDEKELVSAIQEAIIEKEGKINC